MAALDGNAIAGTLVVVFDTELTTAIGACASLWKAQPGG
jgi:hypothetical protein